MCESGVIQGEGLDSLRGVVSSGLKSKNESSPYLHLESNQASKGESETGLTMTKKYLGNKGVEPPPGFEPGASALPGRRSTELSYGGFGFLGIWIS